ncbi:hypothetical protein SLEP1_g13555 [Rubroshorea leprosula]|uniref:Vesicle-fusing ATPase n=1 Tax=Rubroshorea leprosula TaxID=152421 RepID=A0AAV5IGB1_9ROSI|nr:hypothetical protein SLEP1_g13555 [Rubroshorea leprosula]
MFTKFAFVNNILLYGWLMLNCRLLDYVASGPQFSNLILQTLLDLLKRLPPKEKKLLVLGTTSEVSFLESIGIRDAFSVTYHVPKLETNDVSCGVWPVLVLKQLNVFAEDDIDAAAFLS